MSISVPLYGFGSGGGGGTGGILTVTAPAGVTVKVSKDGKTYTKTANAGGQAIFRGLASGTWTVTITDGVQTATRTAEVVADYAISLTFFAATINVTYPTGSVCTCSDGVTTLTAPDTSGTWACVVPNAGTWAVTAAFSKTVSITDNGQIADVDITKRYLYNRGDQFTDFTGGWIKFNSFAEGAYSEKNAVIGENYLKIAILNGNNSKPGCGGLGTSNAIDFTKYKTLRFVVTNVIGGCILSARTSLSTTGKNVASKDALVGTMSIDISGVTGSYHVALYEWSYTSDGRGCTVSEIYLE